MNNICRCYYSEDEKLRLWERVFKRFLQNDNRDIVTFYSELRRLEVKDISTRIITTGLSRKTYTYNFIYIAENYSKFHYVGILL